MSSKPALVKGTRDFGPAIMQRRRYIMGIIEKVFTKYGFLPLETPSMELMTTLTGKYGDEGDKLLFRILNSGDFAGNIDAEKWQKQISNELVGELAEKGLRYDLTIPLARFVAMNRNDITFPFKRYQMQPVWRADRPQKGRYREFWQCDADVIGSDSLINEADLTGMATEVFQTLDVPIQILINHRSILEGIAETLGISQHFKTFVILIDKLDKNSLENLKSEFEAIGLTNQDLEIIGKLNRRLPFTIANIESLAADFGSNALIEKGIDALKQLCIYTEINGSNKNLFIDLSLARGLDYYTGCILEIKATTVSIGSISGGGRYDNLTGVFGFPGVSGVGISFGIDRIYDVMEQLNLFTQVASTQTKALLCSLDADGLTYNYKLASTLRNEGMAVEVFPDLKKLAKQFEFAEKKGIPVVLIAGSSEITENSISYKNLDTKAQGKLKISELAAFLKAL